MAAGLDSIMNASKESQEVLKYLGKTYRGVNRRIQEDEMPADSTIAAVMSMAIHEDLLGRSKSKKAHIDALYQLVDIRGGIGAFEENKMLMQKLCR